LPTPTMYTVQSQPRIFAENSRVADLIDQNLKGWKVDLLKAVFLEDETKVISNIPLSPLLQQDQLIWRGTTHGDFTVRGAYHSVKELQDRARGQCSKVKKGLDVWKVV